MRRLVLALILLLCSAGLAVPGDLYKNRTSGPWKAIPHPPWMTGAEYFIAPESLHEVDGEDYVYEFLLKITPLEMPLEGSRNPLAKGEYYTAIHFERLDCKNRTYSVLRVVAQNIDGTPIAIENGDKSTQNLLIVPDSNYDRVYRYLCIQRSDETKMMFR